MAVKCLSPNCDGTLKKMSMGDLGAAQKRGGRRAARGAKPLANPQMGQYLVCMNEECENYLYLDAENLPTSEKCPKCKKPMHQADVGGEVDRRKVEDTEAQARARKVVWQCQKCKSVFPPKMVTGG